jgi:hypothetical protein
MLSGTADPAHLLRSAPQVGSLLADGIGLPGAEMFMLVAETPGAPALALLPPALHPTVPALLRLVVTRCPESPAGPFAMAELRLECRSGLRPRALLLGGFVDRPAAGTLLAERFGFSLRPGEVHLQAGYCDAEVLVHAGGETVLRAAARDLVPLGAADVQFVSSLHPAATHRGGRLLQVDARPVVRAVRRGSPTVEVFEGTAFGAEALRPTHPVSAVHLALDLEIPPLRFVCKPDVVAFLGTESAAPGPG